MSTEPDAGNDLITAAPTALTARAPRAVRLAPEPAKGTSFKPTWRADTAKHRSGRYQPYPTISHIPSSRRAPRPTGISAATQSP